MKASFDIVLDGNDFFERCQDTDTNCEYEQPADFGRYDKLANGFKWSMATKKTGQRKYHASSGITNSIYAMLEPVRAALRCGHGTQAVCMTPYVEINFYIA